MTENRGRVWAAKGLQFPVTRSQARREAQARSPFIDTAQDGLEVDDWRPVRSLRTADLQAYAINAEDAYAMQANRIGRLGALVLKTPASGRLQSPRGCTLKTLRSASCNHVNMISSPNAMPSKPARTSDSRSGTHWGPLHLLAAAHRPSR